MKNILRNCWLLAVLSAAIVPAYAGTFQLQLDPAPDLSAPPGGTIVWNLMTENDDLSLFLSIDTVNWTAVLDPAQGVPDNFNAFLFPLVAPSISETDELFSIQWLPGAIPSYSVGNSFVISTSFCVDTNYDGCVPNDDVTLPFSASVSQPDTVVPEPGSLWPFGAALAALIWWGRRFRLPTPACGRFSLPFRVSFVDWPQYAFSGCTERLATVVAAFQRSALRSFHRIQAAESATISRITPAVAKAVCGILRTRWSRLAGSP